jgi:hypothetical protein
MPDGDLIVKDFSIPDHWPRAYGLDIRWNNAAAIWGARDPQSDVLYLYSEYVGETAPAIHVAAIRARADWIHGLIDPTANGRFPADGQKLIQMYRQMGLNLCSSDNPLESGISGVQQRMQSGRLKVFASLTGYLEERRLYRRDERDHIVHDRDRLQDAARCLVNGIYRMHTKPVPSPPIPRRVGGSMSWAR